MWFKLQKVRFQKELSLLSQLPHNPRMLKVGWIILKYWNLVKHKSSLNKLLVIADHWVPFKGYPDMLNHLSRKKNVVWVRRWWLRLLIPALRRLRQADLLVPGQPGLQSWLQDRLQCYIEKPCLDKQTKMLFVIKMCIFKFLKEYREYWDTISKSTPSFSLSKTIFLLFCARFWMIYKTKI